MINFKKDGFRKGGSDFGGRPKFGGGRSGGSERFGGNDRGGDRGGRDDRGSRSGGSPELFSAVCTACKKQCEVPFRPSADKPVYCRDCFMNHDKGFVQDTRPNPRREGGDFKRESHSSQRDTQYSRPEINAGQKSAGNDELKKQIAILESKVNRIIELLTVEVKAPEIIEAPKVSKIVKIVKEVKPKITKPKVTEVKSKAKATKVVEKVAKKAPVKKTAVEKTVKKAKK